MRDWRIGRLAVPGDPLTYEHESGLVRVGTQAQVGTRAQADHVRQQIVAMASPAAEMIVPLVIEDGFDGFVRVLEAKATGWDMGQGEIEIEIAAQPVPGASSPLVESVLVGAQRENAHDRDGIPFHSTPEGAVVWTWPDGSPEALIDVEGGQVRWSQAGLAPPWSFSGVAQWSAPPDDWYVGGCSAAALVDGVWLPVAAPGSLIRPWRVSNGLVRWWVDLGEQKLSVQWWGPDGWSTPRTWFVAFGPTEETWAGVSIVRLTPAEARIHLWGRTVHLWATIRRGSPIIDFAARGQDLAWRQTPTAAVSDDDGVATDDLAVDDWTTWTSRAGEGAVNEGLGIIEAPAVTGDDLWAWGLGATHASWDDSGVGPIASSLPDQWYAVQSERLFVGARL